MSAWIQSLLLGVLQGLTEFLPVSSSGHLVLLQAWLGERFFFKEQALAFDLVLHLGTLVPVLWFYRRDLKDIVGAFFREHEVRESVGWWVWLVRSPHRWVAVLVFLGTLPLLPVGLGLRGLLEALFHSVFGVAIALGITGCLLFSTRWIRGSGQITKLTVPLALAAGVAQALAVTPGISRSGSTIAVLLLLGVERTEALRFSFLLAIPAILGATTLLVLEGVAFDAESWFLLLLGFSSALVVGYLALRLLTRIVRHGRFHQFAYYLWPLSLAAFLL